MASIDILNPPKIYIPKPHTHFKSPAQSKRFGWIRKVQPQLPIRHRSLTLLCQSSSWPSSRSGDNSKAPQDDYVTRVLKENPSQIEPRYLVGDKFYTLKEKESLGKNSNVGFAELFAKRLNFSKAKNERTEGLSDGGVKDDAVYLKDILREYKGKLYVPEQIFGTELPEEEQFEKSLKELPRMSYEEFLKAVKSDKVKLLTSKEVAETSNGVCDYIVDLKEIPGEKSLHRTKWAMRLDEGEAQTLLEDYTGPRYMIEGHTTVFNHLTHFC